jgi:DNA-binding NtrC family response regulator
MMKKTIVLIDDDKDEHEIFQIALAQVDPSVQCTYFDSAEDALNILTDAPTLPEYIFLDLNMPGMNGIKFLEEIKRTALASLRIIVYSTAIMPDHKKKIEKLGVFRAFVKPTTDGELVKLLKSVLVQN